VKIYGERNTGTNYLSALLEKNLDVDLLPGVVPFAVDVVQAIVPGHEAVKTLYTSLTMRRHLGWKHMLVGSARHLEACRSQTSPVLFVTLTKNPYSWLLSLHRRPHNHAAYEKHPPDWDTFLRSPWPAIGRDATPGPFRNPVDLWNRKNAGYRVLARELDVVTLRYEDLVMDPGSAVEEVARRLGMSDAGISFENVAESTKGDEQDFDSYRSYYGEDRWKDQLDASSLEFIEDQLDQDLRKHFGYERIDSTA
jgi:hypothetical protein